jgi:hypothetical protein
VRHCSTMGRVTYDDSGRTVEYGIPQDNYQRRAYIILMIYQMVGCPLFRHLGAEVNLRPCRVPQSGDPDWRSREREPVCA